LYLVGGFNPSEKYESQLGLLFPIYENIGSNPPTINMDDEKMGYPYYGKPHVISRSQ